MAVGVSKGMELTQMLHADIRFGDGEKDTLMLTMADAGCVMKNARGTPLHAVFLGKYPDLQMIRQKANDGAAKKLVEVFQLE